MPIPNSIAARAETHTAWRRDLHRHPETAFQETRTAGVVAEKLRAFGCDMIETGIAGTGVVGVIHGGGRTAMDPEKTVLLRADMDALPMAEANTFEHASSHAGAMHACGHDGHTTMLLAAAQHLAETRAFDGSVVLCFQPAEEKGGGAEQMLKAGLQERFPWREAYAMHNLPGLPIGQFAVAPGPVCAAVQDYEIQVSGVGGHAAHPHRASDTIVAAATLVTTLQTLVAREVDPSATAVLSLTSIQGGEAFNVLPDAVRIRGTVRSFDLDLMDYLLTRIRETADGVAAAQRVEITISLEADAYPPTINSAREAAFAREAAVEVVGEDNVIEARRDIGAEDFSFLLQRAPGAYLCVGNGDSAALHNPSFDFDDRAIPYGAAFFARVIERALPRG